MDSLSSASETYQKEAQKAKENIQFSAMEAEGLAKIAVEKSKEAAALKNKNLN